jgi:hypothetical protein
MDIFDWFFGESKTKKYKVKYGQLTEEMIKVHEKKMEESQQQLGLMNRYVPAIVNTEQNKAQFEALNGALEVGLTEAELIIKEAKSKTSSKLKAMKIESKRSLKEYKTNLLDRARGK